MKVVCAILLSSILIISGCTTTANPFAGCEKTKDLATKQQCYGGIAIEEKNPSLCKDLNEDVKDYCYFGSAWGTEDPSSCRFIHNTTARNVCVWNIALKQQNPQVCNDIENKTLADNCIALVTQKP